MAQYILSFYEYKKIMDQNPPKAFADFLEIGYRTGLRSKFLINLKKENVDLKDKTVIGTDPKSSLPIYIVLDDRSFEILKCRIEDTKSEYVFSNDEGKPYPLSYYEICFRRALEAEPLCYDLKKQRITLHSIRAGNMELLKEFRIPIPEILFRQNINIYGLSEIEYVTDQSRSVNALNRFMPILYKTVREKELNGEYD